MSLGIDELTEATANLSLMANEPPQDPIAKKCSDLAVKILPRALNPQPHIPPRLSNKAPIQISPEIASLRTPHLPPLQAFQKTLYLL